MKEREKMCQNNKSYTQIRNEMNVAYKPPRKRLFDPPGAKMHTESNLLNHKKSKLRENIGVF